MDDDIREFGMELGNHALRQDWKAVHASLAPWLQSETTVEDVQDFFEGEYRESLEANGIEEMHYPEYPEPEVGGNNFMSATELRKPIAWEGDRVRDVAPEVTDDIVRYWMNIRLMCSDEQMDSLGFDSFTDIWASIVETETGLRVGYWSHGAY